MRVWKCKQVVDFDQSTTIMKEERSKTLQQKMTDKYNRLHIVTLVPNRILLKWRPSRKKIWSSASELKRTKIEQFWMWIVNSDRQFCRTVYVISWTVALILSSRKIVNLEHMFVSFQDFVGKTWNFSVRSLARFGTEEGYTYYGKFGHKWTLNWKFCSLMNC